MKIVIFSEELTHNRENIFDSKNTLELKIDTRQSALLNHMVLESIKTFLKSDSEILNLQLYKTEV